MSLHEFIITLTHPIETPLSEVNLEELRSIELWRILGIYPIVAMEFDLLGEIGDDAVRFNLNKHGALVVLTRDCTAVWKICGERKELVCTAKGVKW
jgi:hypothetical protein